MERRDKHGHKLILKKCAFCGEEKWMRPQSWSCSLRCNGIAGSVSAHKGKAMAQKLSSIEFREQQSTRLKRYYADNPEKVTRLFGENNPAWRHGEAGRGYTNFTERLKEKIRLREENMCQMCQKKWVAFEPKFDVHHLDGDKDNFGEENLKTLCKSCHTRLHRLSKNDKANESAMRLLRPQ